MPPAFENQTQSSVPAHFVIGTAGHIDHGKSSLVRCLTGVDPDRLPEEQARKLTIDLGFAPWLRPNGRTVGIIDVPGHERFVKNMVAGATGIDAALFVVAADDGVMPQTREHLEILQFLGIERGVIALTKADVTDPEILEVVCLEIQELVEGTFLQGAPIIPVSSITGQGIEELSAALDGILTDLKPRLADGPFRMPIQRVFSIQGFGTVVTGVPSSGRVAVGDTIEVHPGAQRARVRGLQAYKSTVEQACAGHSTAINAPDLDRERIARGAVACSPGVFVASEFVEVELNASPQLPRALEGRTSVRLHLGTAEILAELVLIDRDALLAGQSALAQLRLQEPTVAIPGDRFVIRWHSPLELIGGGRVIGLSRHRLKSLKPYAVERLRAKQRVMGDPKEQILLALADERFLAQSALELAPLFGLQCSQVDAILKELVSSGRVVCISEKGTARFLARELWRELLQNLECLLDQKHREQPLLLSQRIGSLAKDLRVEASLLELATNEPAFESLGRDRIKLRSHNLCLTGADAQAAEALRRIFLDSGLQAPAISEAIEAVLREGIGIKAPRVEQILEALVENGELRRIAERVIVHDQVFQGALDRTLAALRERGPLSASEFREILDSSRKFVIPLLESFDELGYTSRQGEARVLGPKA